MVQSPEAAQLASVEAFKKMGICEQLAEAAAALGWKEPTSIQQQAVPLLLQGADCTCCQHNIYHSTAPCPCCDEHAGTTSTVQIL